MDDGVWWCGGVSDQTGMKGPGCGGFCVFLYLKKLVHSDDKVNLQRFISVCASFFYSKMEGGLLSIATGRRKKHHKLVWLDERMFLTHFCSGLQLQLTPPPPQTS